MNNQDSYPNNYKPELKDNAGHTAKILGIVSLVAQFVCCYLPIVAPILAIIALVYAAKSKRELGMVSGQAMAGKVCAIIALVFAALSLAYIIAELVIIFTNPQWFQDIMEEYQKMIEEMYPAADLSALPAIFRS